MKDLNATMLSIPYIRATYLNDKISEKLIAPYKEIAKDLVDQINTANGGMFTRNVETRSLYFEQVLERNKNNFEQLLVLGVGLDTKYDLLPCLKNKKIFGIDLMSDQIENIYKQIGLISKINFVTADISTLPTNHTLEKLIEKGFHPVKKTFIIWEGGTFYLEPESTKKVLEYLTSTIHLSGFSGDFLNELVFSDKLHVDREIIDNVLQILEKSANPWKGFFTQENITQCFKNHFSFDFTWHEDFELQHFPTAKMMKELVFFVEILNTNYKIT